MTLFSTRRRRIGRFFTRGWLDRNVPRRPMESLRLEALEERRLLAIDSAAGVAASYSAADVNQDGCISAIDALWIIRELNGDGSSAGPAAAALPVAAAFAGTAPLNPLDVNGDSIVSAADAAAVLTALEADETDQVQIRLEVTDLMGDPITQIPAGGSFKLNAYVLDLRSTGNQGVFAAWTDVTFESGLATVDGAIDHGADYTTDDSGTSIPGLLDEVGGAFNAIAAPGPTERLLWSVQFKAGMTGGTINFAADPADVSPTHEVLLFPEGPISTADVFYGTAELTVLPPPTVSIADPLPIAEEDIGTKSVTLTITLSGPAAVPVTVQYQTVEGSAKAGSDYQTKSDSVEFLVGETSKTITVLLQNDTTDEGTETFSVQLSNPQNASLAKGTAEVTVTDNDLPTIQVSDVTRSEPENGTAEMMFTVTLSNASSRQIALNAQTKQLDPVSAEAGLDFDSILETLIFAPGQTSQTVIVPIRADSLTEGEEKFELELKSAGVPQLLTAKGTGTITDPTRVGIAIPAAILEGTGPAPTQLVFTVTRTGDLSPETTVPFSTETGTASEADFTKPAPNATLTFAIGESTKTILIPIIADNIDEGDESFQVKLGPPSNATLVAGQESATGTITDDDATPIVTLVAPAPLAEGNSATKPMNFRVLLDRPSQQAITVKFSTTNGTATAGSDYVAVVNGEVTIPAGQVEGTATVTINGDTTSEGNENFTVTLSDPTNAVLDPSGQITATGVIVEDEATISIDDVEVTEGDTGTKDVTLTVKLSAPAPAGGVTVNFATVPSTAVAGSDFETQTGTVTFAQGQTERTIVIKIVNDTTNEGTETFSVQLSNPQNAGLADGTADVTVKDNDPLPTIQVSNVTVSEPESGTAEMTFTVTLSKASGQVITLNARTLELSPVSAQSGADFDSIVETLIFAPGQTSQTVTVPIRADSVSENDEKFELQVERGTGTAMEIFKGTGTIQDSDAPEVSIVDDNSANENLPGGVMTFLVKLSRAATANVVVPYSTTLGTAEAADFIAPAAGASITFLPGETEKTISIPIINDTSDETADTFNVILGAPENAVLKADQRTSIGTINDDDPAPVVKIASPPRIVEGDTGTKTLTFTVTLSNPSDSAVTVKYNTANGTATAGSDYTAVTNGTVTFDPGQTSKTFTIDITGDTTVEPSETFTVTLAEPTNATLGTAAEITATGTIEDDDRTLSISGPAIVAEGTGGTNTVTYTVKLSAASAETVTVAFATSNGTGTGAAQPNRDYLSNSGTLSFAPGELEKTFQVTIVTDAADDDDNEAFKVTLSNPTHAEVAPSASEVTTTITDDDSPPSITIGDAAVTEGNTGNRSINFPLTLSAPSDRDVKVRITTSNGTATAGSDYVEANSVEVTIPARQTTFNAQVAITPDILVEGNETFTVTISSPINATLGAKTTATGTINDDDAQLTIGDATIVEGNEGISQIEFIVTLSQAQAVDVTFRVNTFNITALANNDYRDVNNVLFSIPAGQTTAKVLIDIAGDFIPEANETFEVEITNPTNARLGTKTLATGTITNDDSTKSISGYAYVDVNNNGMKDPGEKALGGVLVRLSGTDANVLPVDITKLTAADGSYSFDNLVAGNYRVIQTQPQGLVDGKDTFFNGVVAAENDEFRLFLRGDNLANNNFGERGAPPQQITKATFFASNRGAINALNNNAPPPNVDLTSVTSAINITNHKTTTASGTGSPGAHIALVASDGTLSSAGRTTTVAANGTWSIADIDLSQLADGTITYQVAAVDNFGNSRFDTMNGTKRTVAITSVPDPVNDNNETSITVIGTSQPNAVISIVAKIGEGTSEQTTAARTTTADANGNWSIASFDVSSLADGTIRIIATATVGTDTAESTKRVFKGTTAGS